MRLVVMPEGLSLLGLRLLDLLLLRLLPLLPGADLVLPCASMVIGTPLKAALNVFMICASCNGREAIRHTVDDQHAYKFQSLHCTVPDKRIVLYLSHFDNAQHR